ncbi:MAG: hypothetical protein AB7G62_07790 [Magnetospirillum sp.]
MPPAQDRRRILFFSLLAIAQALASIDFTITFGGPSQPHFGGLFLALGIPPFPGLGIMGLALIQVLPVFMLVLWMRGDATPRHCAELGRYVVMAYVLGNGLSWMAFAGVHLLSKWLYHPWMDDNPRTTSAMLAVLTALSGHVIYRRILDMPVMTGSRKI